MSWTISLWYKPTATPTADRVLACNRLTDTVHLAVNTSGAIGYYVSGSFTSIGGTLSLNTMYNISATWDTSGNASVFLNGNRLGVVANFPVDAVNRIGNFRCAPLRPEVGLRPRVGLKPLSLGGSLSRPCLGVIDEVAIWNRALTQGELADIAEGAAISKVFQSADYYLDSANNDNLITPAEKVTYYKPDWLKIWNEDQRTTILPTSISLILVDGEYRALAVSASAVSIWTPSTVGTYAYNYYEAVNNYRRYLYDSTVNGFLLTARMETVNTVDGEYLDDLLAAIINTSSLLSTAIAAKDAEVKADAAEAAGIAAASDAQTAAEDYADTLEEALRLQTDHAIVFYTQLEDPSTGWTAEEKLIHKGDYWRTSSSANWKSWTTTAWELVTDPVAQATATSAASAASTAQTTANKKSTTWASLAVANTSGNGVIGDTFIDSGMLYRCTVNATSITVANSLRLTPRRYTDVANTTARNALTGMITNDTVYQTDTKQWYYYAGSWISDGLSITTVEAQLPRFRGNLATDPESDNRVGDYYYNTTTKLIRAYTTVWADASGTFTALGVGADATGTAASLVPRFRGNLTTDPVSDNRAGDYYYNTTSKIIRAYTTVWNNASGVIYSQADIDARVPVVAPKYLGRYLDAHPVSYNNGDWWMVYGLDDAPLTRGFWYSNGGTPALISGLSTEAQRKYRAVGLEDVLYASNNGYAMLSGVYNPVAIYGVSVMDFLAVNQAFIQTLFAEYIKILDNGSIRGGDRYDENGTTIDGSKSGFFISASGACKVAGIEFEGSQGGGVQWGGSVKQGSLPITDLYSCKIHPYKNSENRFLFSYSVTTGAGSANLAMYEFNPYTLSFTQIGVRYTVGSGIVASSAIALSSTHIVVVKDTDFSLQMLTWTGTVFLSTGTPYMLPTGTSEFYDLTALNATDFVVSRRDYGLYVFRWNGSTFSQVGGYYAITGLFTPSLTTVSMNTIAVLDGGSRVLRLLTWNGSSFSSVATISVTGASRPAITALNGSDIIELDGENRNIRIYRFDGSSSFELLQTCGTLSLTTANFASLCAVNGTDIVFANSELNELAYLRISFALSIPFSHF